MLSAHQLEGGTFKVTSLIPDLDEDSTLYKTGLLFKLTYGDDVFEARLNTGDEFTSMFMNGESVAILQPNVLYKLDIFTEVAI